MLAALFVEERGSGVFTLAGVGVNNCGGGLWQAGCQGYDDGRETEGSTDWGGDFADYLQEMSIFLRWVSRMASPLLIRLQAGRVLD